MTALKLLETLKSIPHNPHYVNRYYTFITTRSKPNSSTYSERHHILPASIWPDYKSLKDNPWNEIRLTAREHYIAHWILAKCFTEIHSQKYAFYAMSNQAISLKENRDRHIPTSLAYEIARKMFSETIRNDKERGRKISESSKGKKLSENTKRLLSEARTGTPCSEESKEARRKTWSEKSELFMKTFREKQSKLSKERMTDDIRKRMSERVLNTVFFTDDEGNSIRLTEEEGTSLGYKRGRNEWNNPFKGSKSTKNFLTGEYCVIDSNHYPKDHGNTQSKYVYCLGEYYTITNIKGLHSGINKEMVRSIIKTPEKIIGAKGRPPSSKFLQEHIGKKYSELPLKVIPVEHFYSKRMYEGMVWV